MGWREEADAVAVSTGASAVASEQPRKSLLSGAPARGIGMGIGQWTDLGPRLLDLPVALLGRPFAQIASYLSGKPESKFLPELPLPYNATTEAISGVLGGDNPAPAGLAEKLTSGAVEGGIAAAFNPVGIPKTVAKLATTAWPTVHAILNNMGLGLLAGGGATAGAEATGGNPLGALAGGLLAGVAVPSIAGRRANAIADVVSGDMARKAKPIVEGLVNKQIMQSAAGTAGAIENLDEAARLTGKIPGFTPSVGEASGSPGVLEMQQRYVRLNPENLNLELAREKGNRAAIANFAKGLQPEEAGIPSDVRSQAMRAVAEETSAQTAGKTTLAARAPATSQMSVGEQLAATAAQRREAFKSSEIRPAYRAAFDAAGDNKAVNLDGVISDIEAVMGEPLSKIKPETLPNTIRAINDLKVAQGKPEWNLIEGTKTPEAVSTKVTLEQADQLRKAINADIAGAKASMAPVADTRLYRLGEVHKSIDNAVSGSALPDSAKNAYAAALTKYREQYVPQFKQGLNYQMFKQTSLNEPKLRADEILSKYFVPGGEVEASQFGRLFPNGATKDATKAGIMDMFRRASVDPVTGFVNPDRAAKFMADYEKPLGIFKKNGVPVADDIASIAKTARELATGDAALAEKAKILHFHTNDALVADALANPSTMFTLTSTLDKRGKAALVKNVMTQATSGDAAQMGKFLSDNARTLGMALSAYEGPTIAKTHVSDLKDVAKAVEIAERSSLPSSSVMPGPDLLRNKTGVSTSTALVQMRAVAAKRQNVGTSIAMIAAPVLAKLNETQFADVMHKALYSPETAKALRETLAAQTPTALQTAGAKLATTIDIAKKAGWIIPEYALGLRHYPRTAATALPVIAGEMNKQE